LAPGMQPHQGRAQVIAFGGTELRAAANAYAVAQLDAVRSDFGKFLQCGEPARVIAVARGGREVVRDFLEQWRQCRQRGELRAQHRIVGHEGHRYSAPLIATIDAKLKHWNHTAKLPKPAARTRA